MIRIGYDNAEKVAAVARYVGANPVRSVVVFGPERFRLELGDAGAPVEHIEWVEIIMYRSYYRLLREIDNDTLVVINEPLRTQNRYDLTYNCLRNFLQQTKRQIVFSRFPLIDTFDDFMVLVDLDTRSLWKRESFRPEMRQELDIDVVERAPELAKIDVPTDGKTRAKYAKDKRALIDGIGLKDPHTIPRNLLLIGGEAKVTRAPSGGLVGRNNRFKLPQLVTYEAVGRGDGETVFEFCHRFIDWADFLTASGRSKVSALVTDLKVDAWYFERFSAWGGRLRDAYAAIHG